MPGFCHVDEAALEIMSMLIMQSKSNDIISLQQIVAATTDGSEVILQKNK